VSVQDCLILVFQDALKALNLTSPSAADMARMVSTPPPHKGEIAPEMIAEASKIANHWHNQCLKLATSTMKEQPMLTSSDRRSYFKQSEKWTACIQVLADWADAQVTP